jgi:HNH endonuclease
MRKYHGRYHAFSGGHQWRGKACFYCGNEASCHDHKIPIIRGGISDAENLTPCCTKCNSAKGARTVDEFRIYAIVAGRIPTGRFFGEGASRLSRDFLAVASPGFRHLLASHSVNL